MTEPETGWELVTDCETAGVIDGKTDLPVRAHPYLPPGMVVAINRDEVWPQGGSDPFWTPALNRPLHPRVLAELWEAAERQFDEERRKGTP